MSAERFDLVKARAVSPIYRVGWDRPCVNMQMQTHTFTPLKQTSTWFCAPKIIIRIILLGIWAGIALKISTWAWAWVWARECDALPRF